MNEQFYITKEGLEKLKQELYELKTVRRKEVAGRIEKAKELGDLSENAEYADAKDEMAFIEGRVIELENNVARAVIIEESKDKNKVTVGSKVTVNCNGAEKIYTIVGSNEADPLKGLISNETPLGAALLFKEKGSEFEVKTPKGAMKCKVLKIE
jgi:transcription elongation factor GreA